MTKNKKKYGMFIPCKSLWAVLTGLFFALFFGFDINAQEIPGSDFTLSFECDLNLISSPGNYLLNFESTTTQSALNVAYNYDGTDAIPKNVIFAYSDYFENQQNTGMFVTGGQFNPENVPSKFKMTKCNGVVTQYYYDIPLDRSDIPIADDYLELGYVDPCIENLQILNYCQEKQAGTSTSCFLPVNNDIGIITGAVEKFVNGATTTELWTFKIPAILYFFIFSIVAIILTIIIAWIYKR